MKRSQFPKPVFNGRALSLLIDAGKLEAGL